MSSILNEGDDDTGGGGRSMNYLAGGFDDEQRRVRRESVKHSLFKLVNLLTFHNVVTNTAYIILLLGEFTQFLGFLFFKLSLASTSTSSFANDPAAAGTNSTTPGATGTPATSPASTVNPHVLQLAYVSYFNLKQLLMEVRGGI